MMFRKMTRIIMMVMMMMGVVVVVAVVVAVATYNFVPCRSVRKDKDGNVYLRPVDYKKKMYINDAGWRFW